MSKNNKITPEGTRDLLFEVCRARRKVEERLRRLFENRGFQEVMTPQVEFYDVFSSASRYFPQESLYKSMDTKGRLLVIRPDGTIPIARLCATKLRHHLLPIRLYYNQNIYRMNPLMNGSSHEIMQMGVELLGAAEGRADLEMLSLSAQCLKENSGEDYRLEIGHVGIFKALMENAAVSEEAKETLTALINEKNTDQLNHFAQQYPKNREIQLLARLPEYFGTEEVFGECQRLFGQYDVKCQKAIDDLAAVYHFLTDLGLKGKIIVDFGLVDQADYYTGLVFRGYIEAIGEPVLSGGRYDKLLEDFGWDLPAIGFGARVDLLAQDLLRKQFAPQIPLNLIFCAENYIAKGLLLAEALNRDNISCEFALTTTVEEAFDYALTKGIEQIYLVGETIETLKTSDGFPKKEASL